MSAPTTTSSQPPEPTPAPGAGTEESPRLDEQEWRGVAAENSDDVSDEAGIALKARSRRLLTDLLRPYRRSVIVLTILVVVENAARLSVPLLVSLGIDKGIPPLVKAGTHGGGLFGSAARPLLDVIGFMLVAVVVQATCRTTFLARSGIVGEQILLELRRRLFRHFQRLDVAFHDRYTSGRVVSRLTNDIDAIQELLSNGFDSLVSAGLTMVGTAIMLLVLDLKLGLACLVGFPFLYLLTRWFRISSTRAYRTVRGTAALVIVHFVETMTGIRAVQAYRRERRNQDIFEDVAVQYQAANEVSFRLVAILMPAIKLIGNLTTGVVILYGGYRAFHGDVTVGVLTAFLLYLRQFFEPMQDISQFYNTLQSASAALEKLSGVLEEQPTVSAPTHPVTLTTSKGAVDFEHVGFAYVPQNPVLPDLDLHVPAGQSLAMVGTTGAGKTTIAKLLARFYDPARGRVLLDGVDLRELSDADLRSHVVMVTQENFMFDGTVAENILFGRPNAPRAQVVAAATAVGAHEFITALPQGYDTDVAKRGGRLSAGQRQLVAFARAFLADPAVLILDEATSSLDIPSERLVQRALQTILAGRTALIIAHRLSTVEVADRVLVLEHGEIVEDGSPADLVDADSGRYADLHRAWVASLA